MFKIDKYNVYSCFCLTFLYTSRATERDTWFIQSSYVSVYKYEKLHSMIDIAQYYDVSIKLFHF